jgi:hypothetical protein
MREPAARAVGRWPIADVRALRLGVTLAPLNPPPNRTKGSSASKWPRKILRRSSPILHPGVVREISYADVKSIIEQYEYLGTMPASVRHCFGIFFAGRLAGAVVYADEPSENLGVWDRLGYTEPGSGAAIAGQNCQCAENSWL